MGPYIHLNVLLPMVGELEHESGDGTHLAELANEQDVALPEEDDPYEDVFSSWDTWDTLRTVCNYDSRLSVGKSNSTMSFTHPSSPGPLLRAISSVIVFRNIFF